MPNVIQTSPLPTTSPPSPPPTPSPSSTPPIKRRRTRPASPRPASPPAPPPPDHDDDNSCSICLEHWSNTGEHHVCCMPCGHLFGYVCISNWLNSQPKRTRACPTCKTPARVRDLRYLFGLPSTLRTADATETHSLRRQLRDEKDRHAATKAQHAATKARLDVARRLARTYRQGMLDLQRSRVACMDAPPVDFDDVTLLGERPTKGGSIAVACDAATVLYTERAHHASSEQRLCRAEINRLSHVTHSQHTLSKRVNAIAVCSHREMNRYIALASADRRVTVVTPSLQLAAQVTVSAVPTSTLWLSTPHFFAVGLLNGEVAIFDIRNPSGPCLRPLLAQTGWRAVHSLGELNTDTASRLIAAAPCGVVSICPRTGVSDPLHVGEGPVAGVSVHDGLITVATKPDKPTLSIYDGLLSTSADEDAMLGNRVGDVLMGYNHDAPFIQPAVLPGLGDRRGTMVVCPDTTGEHGVAKWAFRRDGLDGERWVRQGPAEGPAAVGVRAVACATIPPSAKIDGLPDKVRGVFAAVGDDCVRLFSAGRYR